jgi:hypothetical protein
VGTGSARPGLALVLALVVGTSTAGAEPTALAGPVIVRPEVELLRVMKLSPSTRHPVEQQLVRAQQLRIARFVALDDAASARRRGDRAAAERAELRARLAERRATSHVDAAVALVAALRAEEPSAPVGRRARDLVLLGHAADLSGRDAIGDQLAAELIRVCPRCVEAGDAHLRLGDRAFATATDAASLTPAIEHFAAASAVEAAPADLRAFAEYKLAWCLYNLGDRAGALAHLRWSAALAAPAGSRSERLIRIAQRDADRLLRNLPLSDGL